MKKILNSLLRNLDKIILAILMVLLIGVISWQYLSLASSLKLCHDVESIDLLADRVDEQGKKHPKEPFPPLDKKLFNMNLDIQEPWRESYTHGKWDDYKKKGDNRIFRNYPNPPKTLSPEYRKYIKDYGAGSLFDPPLYVFPRDGFKELVAFETVRTHYRPHNDDTDPDNVVIDQTPTIPQNPENPEAKQETDLSAWVRLVKVERPSLPFILNSVAGQKDQPAETWVLTFKVGGRRSAKFPVVRIGQDIPGTNYKLVSAKVETIIEKKYGAAVQKDVYSAIVQSGDGPKIPMKEREKVNDPLGDSVYMLGFYPYGTRRPVRLKDGEKTTLTFGDIKQTYELSAQNNQPLLALITKGKAGTAKVLKNWSNRDYQKWREQMKRKKAKEREEGGRREEK